jgi:hypothetical protein
LITAFCSAARIVSAASATETERSPSAKNVTTLRIRFFMGGGGIASAWEEGRAEATRTPANRHGDAVQGERRFEFNRAFRPADFPRVCTEPFELWSVVGSTPLSTARLDGRPCTRQVLCDFRSGASYRAVQNGGLSRRTSHRTDGTAGRPSVGTETTGDGCNAPVGRVFSSPFAGLYVLPASV